MRRLALILAPVVFSTCMTERSPPPPGQPEDEVMRPTAPADAAALAPDVARTVDVANWSGTAETDAMVIRPDARSDTLALPQTDARPRDAGAADAPVWGPPVMMNGKTYPPPCARWPGEPVPFAGPLPTCPSGKDYASWTCEQYCGCWFGVGHGRNGHCAKYQGAPVDAVHPSPATAPIFETPGACVAACAAFPANRRAHWYYRARNNDFHCVDAVPDEWCPGGKL